MAMIGNGSSNGRISEKKKILMLAAAIVVIAALAADETDAASSSSSATQQLRRRNLNFLEDMLGGILGNPGSGSASGEFVPGMYSDDEASPAGTDIVPGQQQPIEWGQDGAWGQWLQSFVTDGGLEGLLNGGGGGGLLDGLGLGGDGVNGEGFDLGGLLNGIDLGGLANGAGGDFMGAIGDMFDGDFNTCSLIEMSMGMSKVFGVEANCECLGTLDSGLDVNCSFERCSSSASWEDNEADSSSLERTCGRMTMDFDFGGPDGIINATSCADFDNDDLEQICFSYEIDMRDSTTGNNIDSIDGNLVPGGVGRNTGRCEASYGENACDCSISENFCLAVDCTPYLEDGKMDTCQMLSMISPDDVSNWFPNFDAFLPGLAEGIMGGDGSGGLDGLIGGLLQPGGGGSLVEGGDVEWNDSNDEEWGIDESIVDSILDEDENDNFMTLPNYDSSVEEEEELEDDVEEVPVDITITTPDEAAAIGVSDGDIIALQSSELVNDEISGITSSSGVGRTPSSISSIGIAAIAAFIIGFTIQ